MRIQGLVRFLGYFTPKISSKEYYSIVKRNELLIQPALIYLKKIMSC